MHVAKPAFRYEINLNTALLFVTLIATGVGWGIAYNALVTGRDNNAANIATLSNRIGAIEVEARLIANHELRLSAVERQAGEASTAMRAVERAIGELASDMRLTREILQRLERAQNGRQPP
jgi:predicted nucleic acid-binding protein